MKLNSIQNVPKVNLELREHIEFSPSSLALLGFTLSFFHQSFICGHRNIIPLDLASDIPFDQAAEFLCLTEDILVTANRNFEAIAEAHGGDV